MILISKLLTILSFLFILFVILFGSIYSLVWGYDTIPEVHRIVDAIGEFLMHNPFV